jgi:prepilin-type N-terminal cleavage/methylation domain-containing protein
MKKRRSFICGRHYREPGGFTLIELLVTIAIIMLLAGLLFPAVNLARRAALRTQARKAAEGLEAAFIAYFDEYKRWPTGLMPGGIDNSSAETLNPAGIEALDSVVRMLGGEDVNGQNPRRVPFFEPPSQDLDETTGDYLDPWGNPFKYMLDYNFDNDLQIMFGGGAQTNLMRSVAVWSRGADGDDQAGYRDDDVGSW